ncbi:hypothetical protein MKEN_00009900 [Mycena kentingensis (nom. inval.)]|nr:hypothetical protein MKEN_00009900 [Mycena kentingensis (nom. inval.)]
MPKEKRRICRCCSACYKLCSRRTRQRHRKRVNIAEAASSISVPSNVGYLDGGQTDTDIGDSPGPDYAGDYAGDFEMPSVDSGPAPANAAEPSDSEPEEDASPLGAQDPEVAKLWERFDEEVDIDDDMGPEQRQQFLEEMLGPDGEALLPLISTGPDKEPREFFSEYEPDAITDALLARLRRLVVPTEKTVRGLVERSRQAWLDGRCSVAYTHADGTATRFPLWVITYWQMVIEVKKTVRARWTKAWGFLDSQAKQARQGSPRALLLAETKQLLAMIPWGCAKPAGLSDTEPFHKLWRFLGQHWLSDSQIDDVLELLRQKIENEVEGGRFRVKGTVFMEKLAEAYELGSDAYNSEGQFRWLRELGDELAEDSGTLVTIVHLTKIENNPHWTSLAVEFGEDAVRVLYGDSFTKEIPPKLREICEWWVLLHTGRGVNFETLAIGQQDDGFSCGMLALNSLQHYVDANVPLTKRGDPWVVGRLETFNALTKWTLEQLEAERMELEDESKEADLDAYQPPSPYKPLDPNQHHERDPDPVDLVSARNFDFSFVAPSPVATDIRPPSLKRPRASPNAPTPTATPERTRIFKREIDDGEDGDLPAPVFLFGVKDIVTDHGADVFAPQSSPPHTTSSSPVTGPSKHDNNPRQILPLPKRATTLDKRADPKDRGPMYTFFKIETPEERATRYERESREYREGREIRMQNELEAGRVEREKKLAKDAAYMRGYRARKREERIAKGDIPKRGRKRKAAEAELADEHINNPNKRLPEQSRPFRQFTEEKRQGNKLSGRKRLAHNAPVDAVRIRWHNPLIWQQCLLAFEKARWPWRPCDVVREARQINPPLFSRLTTQVVGRWIDRSRTTQRGGIVWAETVERSLALQSRSAIRIGGVGILLDTTIGTLRNRSVMWVLRAMKDIDKPELVKKAFEMCAIGELNCSQESLTSPSTIAMLRRLSKDRPELHAEFTRMTAEEEPEVETPAVTGVEEQAYSPEAVYDDCDTPLSVAVAVVQGVVPAGFEVADDGGISRGGDVETLDVDMAEVPAPVELGRGKRKRQRSKRYSAGEWEEH